MADEAKGLLVHLVSPGSDTDLIACILYISLPNVHLDFLSDHDTYLSI